MDSLEPRLTHEQHRIRLDGMVDLLLDSRARLRAFGVEGTDLPSFADDGDGDIGGPDDYFLWNSHWSRRGSDGLPVVLVQVMSCSRHRVDDLFFRLGVERGSLSSEGSRSEGPRLRHSSGLEEMSLISGASRPPLWFGTSDDAVVVVRDSGRLLRPGAVITEVPDASQLIRSWREMLQGVPPH